MRPLTGKEAEMGPSVTVTEAVSSLTKAHGVKEADLETAYAKGHPWN